jgi:biotin operon repressor
MAGRRSAEVVLIPKKLRTEWMDVLALDTELTHTAFRVACVIGQHFNNYRGSTYIKQSTVARVMGISERSVWDAVQLLEQRGYILIQRREFGSITRRTKAGKTVTVRLAGGRGIANTYLPAFERSQLSATNNGRKLAARCELWWQERSQNPARKVAAHCDPTLTSSSKKNSSHALGENGDRLRAQIGKDVFDAWFRQITIDTVTDTTVVLIAPSSFVRNWINDHFISDILACWTKGQPTIKRVEIKVRS